MDESEENMSSEDLRNLDSPSTVKVKPKKRSLVERELETSLTARVTSPVTHSDGSSTSRYGRARRLKASNDFCDTDKAVVNIIKSSMIEKTPVKGPAYKMHASNSPIHGDQSSKGQVESNLENQIETIYNTNMSLSRFSSEEKTKLSPSPAKKFPKVYIRTDLIQTKEKEETVTLIKNMFSPVKSTYKPSNSHLSNVLERSSEKYMLNGNKGSKTQNGYLDTSSVVKALDFDGSKKKKKENRENQDNKAVLPKSNLFDIEAQCKYQVGDLGWARMGTYPFWPCMVTREPGTEIFVKKKLFGRIVREIIHVTFFGDNGRRSWIVDSMLRKFLGQREFMAAREQFTPENKKRDPRLYAAFFISDKKQALWSNSVEEAETLLREPKRLRIELLYELITKSRNVKVTPRNQTSGKITRTDSDVSLSESLYDTLFSEDDGKVEDSDKTKGKRNKSLDVSEVVTACLDNMAAKTGITKIQRQSHMDRWLQKAKSKTPEKSQLRVSVTVEKVDETKKKIKTEVNDEVLVKTEETKTKGKSKDKEMKDAKKKQKTVYVPTKKPYSLRQSNNEYQNLQHRHNEHDYSVACVEATENCFVKLNKINIGNHANVDEKGNSVCFIEKVVTQNNHERCDFTTAVDNVAVKPEIDKFFAIENEDTMLEPQIKMEEIPNNIDFDTVMSENFKQRDNVDLNKDSDNFLANISYSLDPTTVENIDVLTKDINIKDQVDKASNVATMNKDTMVEFQIKLENIEKYCDNVDLPNDSDNFLVNASCSIDTPPVEKIDLVTEDINIKDQEILYNESIDSAQSILQDPVKHLLTSEKNYAEFSKEIKEVPAEVEMLIDNDMTDCESIITECDISDKVSLAKETLIQCSINEQLQPSENKSATELVTELEVGHISTDITDCESNISEMDECQTNDKVYIDKETLIQPSTTRQSISIDDRSATEPVNHKVDADISTDVTDCESNMFETDDDDVSDKVSVDKVTLIQSSTTDQLLSIDNKMVTVPVNNKEVADKVIAECDINFIEMDEYNTSDRIFITKETSASLTNKRSELINNKTSVGLNNKEVSDISTDVTDCESDISEIREYNINDNMATDKVRLIQTLTAQEIPSDHKTESDLFNNEQFSDICNVDPKVVEHMELELTPSKYVKSGVEYDIGNREYKRAEPIQNEVIGENSQNAYNVVGMQYLGNKTCAEILLNTDKSSCNLIVKRYKQGEKSCNNNDIQNVGPSDRESEASIQNTFTGNMDYSTDIVNKEYDVDTLCTNSAESVFSIEHEMVEKAIIEPVVNGFMENDHSQRIKAGSITNSDTLSLSSECDDISHKLKKRRLCKFEKKDELGNGNSIHLERLVNGTEDSKSKNMTNNLSKIGNVYSESCGQIEINIDSNLDVPLNKRKLRLKRSNTPSETIKQENGFSESKESNLEDNFYAETESIQSENSDIASGKPKVRSNIITDKKVDKIQDPEFLRYLEFRQDLLIDEHPELTSEEIVEYLFKTWIYEESRKSDLKKTDDIEQSNLVKGLNQEPLKPKRVKKKMKKLIDMEKVLSKEPIANSSEDIPRDKPKRKKTQPYYNEEYSDIEEEIQMFEIFQAKKSASKDINVSKPTEVTTSDIKPTGSLLKSETDKTAGDTDDIVPEEYDIEEVYFEELTNPKPNVFKGFVREKVCEICEKTVNLLKCKGCNGMFHIDCVKKETEIIDSPVPLRGRKKKKKPRGRKPKNSTDSNGLDSESQSDEKSQDLNVSEEQNISIDDIIDPDAHIVADAENFETQLAAKMKELLEAETVQYDSYSSDDGLDWNDSVAGKCQIVDIKLKPKSRSTDSQYSEFKCNNCQKDDTPICFVCKSPVSPKDQSHIRQRCHVAHCHKYYHLKCLDNWPQTQFNSGEPSRSNKKINEHFEPLTCPRHVCHTCVCDDPRGCNTRFCGDKLARCVRCPATYHSFTKCLPAGTQILTASHIICPRHYEHRPGKVPPCHVNTGWCFICALGGTLICCEYCPTSFHAECLNIKPPEGGYMCEDCETGRLPLYGEMVWVKLGHYRWWPGIVLHPIEIPANIMAVKHSPGEFVVRFFGQYDHYWVNRGRVFPFQEGDSGRISSQKSKIDEAFTKAMQHAQRAFEILKNSTPNEVESHDIALSLLPPHYVKLRVNKPSGSLCSRRVDVEEGSLTQCECRDDEEDPCGVYSHCLNRMLLTECGPTCRTGERCNNRAFEKRLYPKLVPYRTPHRGWGLKTLEDIKAGHFVIEYVGELIDEEEFKRRMRRKHEIRDENFYFLTLDKERMIDAGPKGNLARFMNHCCEPNCETQKWTVLGDIRVGLFAIGDIPANSEVTFNYNLECAGIDKKRCMCGAKRCSGYIGAKPKQDDTQTKKNKVTPKRTYKKRKPDESPTTSKIKAKRPVGRPCKPRELTEIEKDLLIIKNATNGLSSDSEGSGRLSSIDVESEKKDAKALKRKRVSFSTEEVVIRDGSSPSVKRMKMDNEKSSEVGD